MKKYFIFSILFLTVSAHDIMGQAIEGKLLGQWSVDTLIGTALYDNVYNEVWGVTNNGREYAIIGSTYGTHFIDVTDPENLSEVVVVKGRETSDKLVHRDYHDHAGLLYAVAAEGNSSLQIIDYSFLPDSVSILYDSNEQIKDAHNIFIDTSSALLYAGVTTGTLHSRVPMRIFDISDPLDPKKVKDLNKIGDFSFSQMHDAYVVNDTAFINCGPHGLLVAEFSDPANPSKLASLEPLEYPQSGYNHSGWLSEDHKTYYMADETWGTDLKAVDVTNLPDLTVIDTFDAGSTSEFSITHNQIVHGNYLYVAYYYEGLQVWDITDPNNITHVLYYGTSELEPKRTYEGAWGVYPFLPSGNIIVSDMQNGLFLVEAIDKTVSTEHVDPIKNEWQVYPNPVSNVLHISTKLDLNEYEIDLLNVEGQILSTFKGESPYNLNVPNGVYFLRISNSKLSSVKSVFVAH